MTPQSQEPTFFLLKCRLPASETGTILGRVVRQYQNPTFDYTPQSPTASLTPEIYGRYLLGPQYDDNATFTAQVSRDEKLLTKLLGLFSTSSSISDGGTTAMSSPRITTRRLKLENDYFNDLKNVPEVRRKMLDMCPVGGKVHLIVGTMSVQTATFKRTSARHSSKEITGSVPVGAIASAAAASAGVPLPPIDASADLGVAKSSSSSWGMESVITTIDENGESDGTGEEVFAISCREVTRDWRGLGSDVKMRVKQPEYRGGHYFGDEDSDSDSELDEYGEEPAVVAADGLRLVNVRSGREDASGVECWLSNPPSSTSTILFPL